MILFTNEEWNDLYNALLVRNPLVQGDDAFPYDRELGYDTEEKRENQIRSFILGLKCANEAAYKMTYSDHDEFADLELRREIPKMEIIDLWHKLGEIKYNCISNGGRSFISDKDKKIMENIRSVADWYMYEEIKDLKRQLKEKAQIANK